MARETVVRIRTTPDAVDKYDNVIPGTDDELTLTPTGVEPGASAEVREQARNGETIAFTVYFKNRRPDVIDGDHMKIRGNEFGVRVIDWRSQRTGRGGLVVLASLARG